MRSPSSITRCARTVTGRRPCHLVATHMASAVAARYPRSRREANRESASYPARRCLTAIFRARVEGDGRLRRHTMDGVDHCFKQYQPIAREADTCADHYTVVNVAGQEAFNRRNCGLVGFDKAVLRMPAPPCEIGQREFDPSVDLLRGHARWQRRVRKVHRRRIKTDKQDAFHWPSKAAALLC